jgi:uncharacterized membrane protein YgdD (TMEM256/DUF423 family)
MNKNYIIISALFGALGVALGAFGAHGLKDIISAELLETYRTGIFYHLIHSVVLLSISLSSRYDFKAAYFLLAIGIILFSFSLYLYTLTNIILFVMITPFGGISLILGWILIITAVMRKNSLK